VLLKAYPLVYAGPGVTWHSNFRIGVASPLGGFVNTIGIIPANSGMSESCGRLAGSPLAQGITIHDPYIVRVNAVISELWGSVLPSA